jgi:hypothetical protein
MDTRADVPSMNAALKRDDKRPARRPADPVRAGSEGSHSFILRVRLDPRPSGRGAPRARFHLEEVEEDLRWHFTDFDRVVECLSSRVDEILRRASLP